MDIKSISPGVAAKRAAGPAGAQQKRGKVLHPQAGKRGGGGDRCLLVDSDCRRRDSGSSAGSFLDKEMG
eukprot:gene12605-biopygen2743